MQTTSTQTILILGDSLSAEYGIARGQGWVKLAEKKLQASTPTMRLINASISGETTAGGRQRLRGLLQQYQPQIVVIELGGNDALRGLDLQGTEENLRTLIKQSQEQQTRVLLVGTRIPPNYGKTYSEKYFQLFSKLRQEYQINLVPFLMAGFADQPNAADYFQADGIHPNEAAQSKMADNILRSLEPMLKYKKAPKP